MFKAATTTRTRMHRKQDHNLIKSGTDTTRKTAYNSIKNMANVQVALVFHLTKATEFQGHTVRLGLIRILDYGFQKFHDVTFTLVDGDMGDCKVKFKYASRRLGCGWRRFSTAHELVVGDAMVFHLVKPAEFKVYISRAYSLSGVDKDFGLRDSEAPTMQNTTCTSIRTHEKTELKCPSTLPFGNIPVIISDSERADS
ncbi:hypothetical protein GIB67_006685 [Kingdonia uniflora]|uniref:TF-B3 domain-containing protein n=1 Tax=Kingdonia uniflora TaxID=39325 RepID=A0A7J7LAR4_9MAGN|nr:hypothetical protein GIB67_006685 [Kingdonia uniflora]